MTLVERLHDSLRRIGAMCKEGRPPSMSIPADRERDDDLFICDTLCMAEDSLAEAQKKLAQMVADVRRVADWYAGIDMDTSKRLHGLADRYAEPPK